MDYQIFTFSFKFFMVLLTMLSSPLFSFVYFVRLTIYLFIFLFISYLLPPPQLVFWILNFDDHSQDHSNSQESV